MKEAPQMSHKTWTGMSLIKTRLHVNTVLFNPHTHPMRKKSDRKIAQDYMLVSGRARPYTSVWFPQTPSPSTIFVGRNRIQKKPNSWIKQTACRGHLTDQTQLSRERKHAVLPGDHQEHGCNSLTWELRRGTARTYRASLQKTAWRRIKGPTLPGAGSPATPVLRSWLWP